MANPIDAGNSNDIGNRAQQWLGTLEQGAQAIAERLGLDQIVSDLESLLAAPSVLDRFLPSDQRATAPTARQDQVASQTQPEVYRVKSGDTLGEIAAKKGTTVERLARLNNIADPNKLSVGQKLTLDGNTAPARTQIAAPATTPATGSGATNASGLSEKGLDFLFAKEAKPNVSNHLHWPKQGSGVTLGAGYDMKGRDAAQIQRDLTAIGVSPDAARIASGGAGLTGTAARDFAAANKSVISLTPQQERTLLEQTVAPYAQSVRDAITAPVTQNQYDAMVSFAYNIGTGQDGFKGSTALKRLNAGDTAGAAEAMTWWNKSGGAVSQGLINRRNDEVALFNTPSGPAATAQPKDAAPAASTTPVDAGNRSPDALARVITDRGDAQAKADLDAGKKVVVALRTDTPTGANGGKGVYDDSIAVVWKDDSGKYQARVFDGNTEPSAQYAWDGPKASRGSHTDMNGDGKMDLGRLQAGTIRYERQSGEFLGNTFFRATRTQVAERDTNQDGRFTAADTNRIDRSGAGTSMLIHQGGAKNTWSAGCQTIPQAQFNDFVAALGGQKGFSYVLTDAR